ncbi:hypothetical protein [Catenulispora subtropica]|uniref:Uncharacterized protein n=1 Tax=Catenulispora subtropica TaxID=450798 RepID=A0ABP5ENW5_9ACTN
MDETLWSAVGDNLAADHCCVVPVLPLGAHRRGVRAEADLSPHGLAALVAEFLDAVGLRDVAPLDQPTRLAAEIRRFLAAP